MAKLQLYIAKSYHGYKSLMNIHPEEDVRRYVGDYRAAVESVQYDASRINIMYLLQNHSGGVLITLIRTIPDKIGDHLAATIFVSDKIVIEPLKLVDILGQLRDMLSAPEVSATQTGLLRELFDTDYPTIEKAPLKVPSDGKNYVYARIREPFPTLSDYASSGFYTPLFGDNAGVLLLPDGLECKLEDVTPKSLPKLIALNPPETADHGFVPHIYHHVFNAPYLVPENSVVDIVWRKGGFDTITQTVKATNPDITIEAPNAADSRKTITPATFLITAEKTHARITNATVKVNGCEITGPTGFTYSELERASVEITAPGYLHYSGKFDLATTTQAIVQMREHHKTYYFDLPIKTPQPEECVHFTIETKQELTESPVEGYTISGDGKLAEGAGHINTLIFTGSKMAFNLQTALIAGIVGLLVGLLAGWLLGGHGKGETTPTPTVVEQTVESDETYPYDSGITETVVVPQSEASEASEATETTSEEAAESAAAAPEAETREALAPTTSEAPSTTDIAAAKGYLDSHKVWKKEELEQVGLNGLFEDMNEYNFERIKTYWAPRLEGSTRFGDLLRAVEGAASKRDPRMGAHAPTYNRPEDTSINVNGYRFHVDP